MLLIVWHSRTGAARAMAEAALRGAEAEGAVCLLAAAEATPADLLAAAGYLFVCPENLGTMSGAMKEFFDRTYYPLLGEIEGRAFATAIAAGSDGSGAERQIERIVTGWRLRRIAEGLTVNLGAQTPEAILAAKTVPDDALKKCHDLGQSFAAGLAMGAF
ncbi:flavodoxin [Novosphingobium fuchskuhlense]|uniref:Flavodoxin n=1 Tax=Novosphingobium fuchskuhlense TaxID=1117702 RepID=A0A117UVS5_9SPHN|nr:NAD(P)H-dependent oxidoreductase [Novosphingobium fuchskuhlense]KUR71799.1 flavodoxin [Novosphingobium fuchskuhlense]